ncbi:MAG: type II secretion system protein E (GspE), type IV pilus assembly protein PilB [Candidatus Woesebacteria bacterium GW2011_GWC1_43_10b]|uniref:Type II secretion system protein E (GspE), type IV pilus assembly protein PilB n=1 Tax=Candidatus Woesebacteria bacterium GW2011_GWC1_43_10b TaxID=1618585 RepID=A0A0G1C4L4_9BACT|nr:MAG: type II secretion system protein E (GspE), type IV pilus assembly protein PilB [Candidatus Woesebacteria bacterium GW2011_GWC1_43_10b]
MAAQPTTTSIANGESAKSLADVLVSLGLMDASKAEQVKFAEVQTGKPQEAIIKDQALVDETALTRAKASLYNIPYLDLSSVPVSPEALSTLPQEVALRFKAFPVSMDPLTKEMVVAMADPMDLAAIQFIEQKTGYYAKPHAADPSKIEAMIATGYTTSLAKEVSEALREVPDKDKIITLDASKTGLIREEKVAQIVTHILSFAVKARASDVHIEPQEKATRVRYRIDGILQEKLTTPRELHDALISRIKILSGMKIDEKRVPQDGRFNFKAEDQEVDLRVSTLPTTWGEKVVMRLLRKTGGIPDLSELGLRGRALKNLEDSILRPHGIILITGPTGSGKTTTLYSVIQKINTPRVNIVTLEDPIEYKIAGVNQVQVNPVAGLTFASGLRSYTNDASGALPRLLDMGAEPYLLASSMTAIVGQRVVRKIHEGCKTSYVAQPKVVEEMKGVLGNLWPKGKDNSIYKGKGDVDCGNSGYFGRVAVFEVLPVTEKISRLILERASSAEIETEARNEGMITMKQDGYLKVLEGITTAEEVLRVAQE